MKHIDFMYIFSQLPADIWLSRKQYQKSGAEITTELNIQKSTVRYTHEFVMFHRYQQNCNRNGNNDKKIPKNPMTLMLTGLKTAQNHDRKKFSKK